MYILKTKRYKEKNNDDPERVNKGMAESKVDNKKK